MIYLLKSLEDLAHIHQIMAEFSVILNCPSLLMVDECTSWEDAELKQTLATFKVYAGGFGSFGAVSGQLRM